MLDAIDRRDVGDEALERALGGEGADLLDWLIGGDRHVDRHAAVPPEEESGIEQIALAVAVGALPLSELRRALETRGGATPSMLHVAGPCAGDEDTTSGSFLDRYLGAGVEPTFEDALALFPERREDAG